MGSKGYILRLTDALNKLDTSLLSLAAGTLRRADTVYVLGNGGSQANAAHLVLHLRDNGIKAFDVLADNAWASAMANDLSYEWVPNTLPKLGDKDVAFEISGSGESQNVINLLDIMGNKRTIGLLGMGGGRAKGMCGLPIIVDSDEYGVIEDVHLTCIHIINELLKEGA